jgi:hypothetical protein
VVRALTDSKVKPPELVAANEAAVYAVFRHVYGEVEVEIDEAKFADADDLQDWRRLVLAARQEAHADEESDPDAGEVEADSSDLDEWDMLIEGLADRILWDRDWEAEDDVVDLPPEAARAVHRLARIGDDYFVAAPDEPTEVQVSQAMRYLRKVAEG